ncbi:hypothetical protein CDAR_96191 [Caerostris darwini]|uniref:Uncharacterized protein n=1 Tax=Caerostris darwini TaxID=1538125 RepID=A0AAV4TMR0_9ARAC|nr:hypothetical protein CDAR_96191 [Caerostris darwini]
MINAKCLICRQFYSDIGEACKKIQKTFHNFFIWKDNRNVKLCEQRNSSTVIKEALILKPSMFLKTVTARFFIV